MNGVHDMGGMDGFGKVEAEPNEPMFHERWEGRVLAMVRALGAAGAFNLDMFRFAQESLPPQVYLESSYYQRWLRALERLMSVRGVVARAEASKLNVNDVERVMVRGKFGRNPQTPARFKLGDRVRARNMHPLTHTRLPRYARGRVGVIERNHGCHVYPDSSAMDDGENPQWLYTVVFNGRELWGADSDPTVKVSIDAFEPYLEPA